MAKKPKEINFAWGLRLKELREKSGKTQMECAVALPGSKRQWERWEAGTVPPKKNWRGIAHVLGVTLEELQGESGQEATLQEDTQTETQSPVMDRFKRDVLGLFTQYEPQIMGVVKKKGTREQTVASQQPRPRSYRRRGIQDRRVTDRRKNSSN